MTAPAIYVLEALQSVMVDRLTGDSMFSGDQSANGAAVPIITEFKGDLITQITANLGKLGICLVVLTPLFEFTKEWAPSLDGFALISVDVYEDVMLNPTKIRALPAAQRILALMHHYPTGIAAVAPPDGEWDMTTSYPAKQIVGRYGSNYLNILPSTGDDPFTDGNVHWALLPSSKFVGVKRPLQLTGEGPPLHYTVLFQAHLSLATPQP